MTVVLTSTTDVPSTASISFFAARCAWVSPVCSITSGAAAGWLLRYDIPAINVASVVKVRVTNTGTAALQLQTGVWVTASPTGDILGSDYPASVTIAAGAAYTWELTPPVVPAATAMRVVINLASTAAAGSQFTVGEITATATATADEILAAPLSRPLRRTADDVLDSADYRIVAGTPGRLRGTITYLCSTLAAARAVDTIYQGAPAVILSDAGNPLDGLKHLAVGEIRYGAERTVPGVPARWTLTADIREVA